ncbi:MAG: caspase family protein [Pirellulaceae bacterium]
MQPSHVPPTRRESRRRFLKTAAAAAVAGTTVASVSRQLPAQTSRRQGLALCIGLNQVDRGAYGGWDGALSGCVPDMEFMAELARQRSFYDVKLLKNELATIAEVERYVAWAANDLRPGDLFMISCSSHGAFRTDRGSDELDGRDETWCLWDGQWTDDQRYRMWQRFAPGVRLLIVADMCHSGTTHRAFQAQSELERAKDHAAETRNLESIARDISGSRSPAGVASRVQPLNITDDLGGPSAVQLGNYAQQLQNATARDRGVLSPDDQNFGARFNLPGGQPSPIRSMPDELALYLSAMGTERSPVPDEVRAGSDGEVRASGLLLAACQDDQTALDGRNHGVFTAALKRAWNNGNFGGSYDELFQTVLQMLRNYPSHRPNQVRFGTGPSFLGDSAFRVG